MDSARRLLLHSLIFLVIVLGGCLGYLFIEGPEWTVLDALYQTMITLTTVGFQEVHPLSSAGRIFTMALVLSGMGFIFFFLFRVTAVVVEGTVKDLFGRRKLEKKISHLEGHYIICGYGRIGRTVAQLLQQKPLEVVVIDKNVEYVPEFQERGILYLLGEATDEEILIKAGIEKAKGLVAVVSSDADNVYITLTARGLNPKLFILARAAEEASARKMIRAGADKVVSPYDIGARRMANTILRPTVIDFIELAIHTRNLELQMEEIIIREGAKLQDVTLMESAIRKDYNLIVVAIKKKSGEMIFNPSPQDKLHLGDTLVVLGDRDNLTRLERQMGMG
jgi:voltage-gated potassium channel